MRIDESSRPYFKGYRRVRSTLGSERRRRTRPSPKLRRPPIARGQRQAPAAQPQPAQFAVTGYYPTKYCTKYDSAAAVYRVSLQDFVYRK